MIRIGSLIRKSSFLCVFFAFVLFCFLPDSNLEEVSPQEEKAAQHLPPLNKAKNPPNKEKRGALSLKSRDSFRIFEHLFILTLYFTQCFQFSSNVPQRFVFSFFVQQIIANKVPLRSTSIGNFGAH